MIASVDELLLDSDSEFLHAKTHSKKKSLPKVIQVFASDIIKEGRGCDRF